MAPTPTSRRLKFELVGIGDLEFVAKLHADTRVSRQLVDGVPDTIDKARIFLAWTQQFDATGYGTWVVRSRSDHRPLGLFSLIPFQGDHELLELGGKLDPASWGGRIAIEAGLALIDHAFETLSRERIVSAIHPDNRSAARALEMLGFQPVGDTVVFARRVAVMALARSEARASHSDYRNQAAPVSYGT